MPTGYRTLGFRLSTPLADIDILALGGAVRGGVAFMRRASLLAAIETVTPDQRERLRRAGRNLAARRPGLAGAAVRLDLMALAPGKLPRHIPDAWKGE
jgi:putative endonuclease